MAVLGMAGRYGFPTLSLCVTNVLTLVLFSCLSVIMFYLRTYYTPVWHTSFIFLFFTLCSSIFFIYIIFMYVYIKITLTFSSLLVSRSRSRMEEATMEPIIKRIRQLRSLVCSAGLEAGQHGVLAGQEGLLDALMVLYEECNKDYLKREENVSAFVNKCRYLGGVFC